MLHKIIIKMLFGLTPKNRVIKLLYGGGGGT